MSWGEGDQRCLRVSQVHPQAAISVLPLYQGPPSHPELPYLGLRNLQKWYTFLRHMARDMFSGARTHTFCPGWCGSAGWRVVLLLKGSGFDSWAQRVGSLVRTGTQGSQSMFLSHIDVSCLPSTLSKSNDEMPSSEDKIFFKRIHVFYQICLRAQDPKNRKQDCLLPSPFCFFSWVRCLSVSRALPFGVGSFVSQSLSHRELAVGLTFLYYPPDKVTWGEDEVTGNVLYTCPHPQLLPESQQVWSVCSRCSGTWQPQWAPLRRAFRGRREALSQIQNVGHSPAQVADTRPAG